MWLVDYILLSIIIGKFVNVFLVFCQDRIEQMTDEERKNLLISAGRNHPSFFLGMIDQVPHGSFHPQPEGDSPDWCSCGKCRDMPTQQERLCCGRPLNSCQSDLPVIFPHTSHYWFCHILSTQKKNSLAQREKSREEITFSKNRTMYIQNTPLHE